ncbi:MAG TPA: DUF4261 domain-containing protein [Thermoanaerobaculia bacterium]|nr:DUF4261 domain-containing protein [Thermoanaerobaculia bacterium]
MDAGITIGVPGSWETRGEVVAAIARHGEGFSFDGNVLVDAAAEQSYAVEVCDHDPRLHEAFRWAGVGQIPERDIRAIARHGHTLYCRCSDRSADSARGMLRVGAALLEAGGLAVKVDSSGGAYSAELWREFAASGKLVDLYSAFVTLAHDTASFFSCGMHNFGLPDAAVPRDLPDDTAAQLLNVFNYYRLAERPSLKTGHTFSVEPDGKSFRISKAACSNYGPQHPFHNPFGMWKLKKVRAASTAASGQAKPGKVLPFRR